MANKIRLMTHNVWSCDNNSPKWAEKGLDCSAVARAPGLLRVYRDTIPDVIGGQEFTPLMSDLIKEGLSELNKNYTLIWGRYTPIIYRSDRIDLVESEFGTFSEDVPGFDGSFNNERSKSWNLAVFRLKENGKLFIFVTVHLWWKKSPENTDSFDSELYQLGSDEARAHQIATVVEKINEYREKYKCPAVLLGDMNTGYNSVAMRYVREHGFSHAHDIATEYSEDKVGYHYCFWSGYETEYYDKPFESAIDHIYVIGERGGTVKRFERYSPDYYYPISDHSAAYIDMQI